MKRQSARQITPEILRFRYNTGISKITVYNTGIILMPVYNSGMRIMPVEVALIFIGRERTDV